ncbi:major facilitator superfamily transporter [Diplocarpon rosae]|nr:major facilitator superfamily transporter [Diplocarpon rosae]
MAEDLDMGIDFLPGTSRLFEDSAHAATSHLKRDGEIVLSPQPSDSPNDPLNWSLPRKYLHAVLLVFVTGLTAATANDAGSAQDGMHAEYGITYETMNIGGGVLFVGIGYWTFLISPAASLYGRRIVYLVSMTLGLIGAIWFTRVREPSDAIMNQLFVGASESVGEASVQLSLSEIFFEHQVGSVIGTYVLATNVGNYLGPVIAAYVAEHLGWRWIAWLAVIICACTLVVLYFGLEETRFDRAAHSTIDGVRGDGRAGSGAFDTCHPQKTALATTTTTTTTTKDRDNLHEHRSSDVAESNWYGPPRNYSVIATGLMNVPCIIGVVC